MTWIERTTTDFVITFADPDAKSFKEFKPLWLNANKSIEYNLSEFVFSAIGGSLVKRGTPRGRQYTLDITFQGLDHIDVARDFEDWAGRYSKKTGLAAPWVISHPYYGELNVQPVSMSVDNNQYNVSVIRATVIETIRDNGKAFDPGVDPAPIAQQKATALNAGFVQDTAAQIPEPDATTLQSIRQSVQACYAGVYAKMNGVQADIDKLTGAYNDVNRLLNNVIFDTQELVNSLLYFLMQPAYFTDTLSRRIQMLVYQSLLLADSLAAITRVPERTARALKQLYEVQMGAVMVGLSVAPFVNIGSRDFLYRPTVLGYNSVIMETYNTYLQNMYNLQSLHGGLLLSWFPGASNQMQLHSLVQVAVAHIMNMANQAKQQRVKTLMYPSSLVLLAHELYGLLPDDSTIIQLKENNNIGLSERWLIPTGREIIYYV